MSFMHRVLVVLAAAALLCVVWLIVTAPVAEYDEPFTPQTVDTAVRYQP